MAQRISTWATQYNFSWRQEWIQSIISKYSHIQNERELESILLHYFIQTPLCVSSMTSTTTFGSTFSIASSPSNINDTMILKGPCILEVVDMINISVPQSQDTNASSGNGDYTWKFVLTDGRTNGIIAYSLSPKSSGQALLFHNPPLPKRTKLVVSQVQVVHQALLLDATNCIILGIANEIQEEDDDDFEILSPECIENDNIWQTPASVKYLFEDTTTSSSQEAIATDLSSNIDFSLG